MRCNKCRHEWEYKGKSHRVTCPNCDQKVKVDNLKVKVDNLVKESGQINKSIFAKESKLSDRAYYQNKLNAAIANNDISMIEHYKNRLNNR